MEVTLVDASSLKLEGQLCFALYSTLHAVGKTYATMLPDLNLPAGEVEVVFSGVGATSS